MLKNTNKPQYIPPRSARWNNKYRSPGAHLEYVEYVRHVHVGLQACTRNDRKTSFQRFKQALVTRAMQACNEWHLDLLILLALRDANLLQTCSRTGNLSARTGDPTAIGYHFPVTASGRTHNGGRARTSIHIFIYMIYGE